GAVGAAEEPAIDLHPVPDDPARAVFTHRRQPRDGALERVERVHPPGGVDLERHPVVVTANLARRHTRSLRPPGAAGNRKAKPRGLAWIGVNCRRPGYAIGVPSARQRGPVGPLVSAVGGVSGLGGSALYDAF